MHMMLKGDKLVIEIDVSDKAIKAAPLAKSGKNKLVASTGGFQAVNGSKHRVRVGLNVIADNNQ